MAAAQRISTLIVCLIAVAAASPMIAVPGYQPSNASFSAVVVFGDSLSDNGNGAYKISNGTWPPSFYYDGHFSNGPVWNEYLARYLGISEKLYNYAVGGSTTSNTIVQGYTGNGSTIPVPSTDEQVTSFLESIPPGLDMSTTLFTISGGINDLFFDPNISAYTSMATIAQQTARLQDQGAQHFLFLSYYDASMIPFDSYTTPDVKADNLRWSVDFNKAIDRLAHSLRDTATTTLVWSLAYDLGLRVYFYGEPTLYGYDAYGAYGSCVVGTYRETPTLTVCDDADTKVFWDEYHPTTKTHMLMAQGMLNLLQSGNATAPYPSEGHA